MRRTLGIGTGLLTAAVLAALAGSAASSDIYISGKVLGRVQGTSSSLVQVSWNYKCLGDQLGTTYKWTLKVVRTRPLPEQTTTLGSGTSLRGSKTIQLPPGEYLPKADPFQCETDRGVGYDKPETGAPFTVPDYCSWTVSSARGLVQLEHGGAVKAARPGSIVAPGDALVTPKSGQAMLKAAAGEGTAALAGGSRLEVDAKHCASNGGWKLRLDSGRMTASAPSQAKGSRTSVTPNATVTASGSSRWDIAFGRGETKVKALAGQVRVAGKTGAAVVVKAGRSVTVKGSRPPA